MDPACIDARNMSTPYAVCDLRINGTGTSRH